MPARKKEPANVKTITFKLPKLTTDVPTAYKMSGHENLVLFGCFNINCLTSIPIETSS